MDLSVKIKDLFITINHNKIGILQINNILNNNHGHIVNSKKKECMKFI